MSLPNPTPGTEVVVTGASSGIGTELAKGLARGGHDLALVARRKDRLDTLAGELRDEYSVNIAVHPCDLGDAATRRALVDELTGEGYERDVVGVCNCAGFGTTGTYHELPYDRERAEVEVNAVAVHELTHAFLPAMIRAGQGAVLNVASIAAFQPIPRMATYAATKAFVQTFSEAIQEELRGTGVSCTVLCPGPVATEWAEIAGAESIMLKPTQVSPHDVADAAIAAMEHGKRSVVPGLVPKALSVGGRFAPRSLLLPGLRLGGKVLRSR